MKALFLLLVSFFFISSVQPQDMTEEPSLMRLEIPARSDQETYRIIPVGKQGMLLFYRSVEVTEEQQEKWYFTLYDTTFQKLWTSAVPLEQGQDFRLWDFDGDTLLLFFLYEGKEKDQKGKVSLLRITLHQRVILLNAFRLKGSPDPVKIRTGEGFAVAALNYPHATAEFAVFNFRNESLRTFPAGEGEETALLDMDLLAGSGGFISVSDEVMAKKERNCHLFIHDTSGKVLLSKNISTITPDRILSDLRILLSGRETVILMGTYTLAGSRSTGKNYRNEAQAGIFFTRFEAGEQKQIVFINLLDLKNINLILSEKEILATRKKGMRKSAQGQENTPGFNLIAGQPVIKGDRIYFGLDSYVPQYHTEHYTDYDFYGRPYTNSYSVFDGYRFTGAILTVFTPDGRLLWDNITEIRNLVSFQLQTQSVIHVQEDKILMGYLADGKIGSKLFKGSAVTGKLEYDPLELRFSGDKLVSETRTRMIHWYDQYFLCYGYQEIKNITDPAKNNRLVYYVNKLKTGE